MQVQQVDASDPKASCTRASWPVTRVARFECDGASGSRFDGNGNGHRAASCANSDSKSICTCSVTGFNFKSVISALSGRFSHDSSCRVSSRHSLKLSMSNNILAPRPRLPPLPPSFSGTLTSSDQLLPPPPCPPPPPLLSQIMRMLWIC